MSAVATGPGTSSRSSKTRAAQRRAKRPPVQTDAVTPAAAVTPASNDRATGHSRVNTTTNPRAGKKFKIALNAQGQVVHIYDKRDLAPGVSARVVVGAPKKGLKPAGGAPAPSVLGTQSDQFKKKVELAQRAKSRTKRPRANVAVGYTGGR